MFDRARNFVMTALFGTWVPDARPEHRVAVDGSTIPPNEWHLKRWADGGWQYCKASEEAQHEMHREWAVR